MDDADATIAPQPDDAVRTAVLHALAGEGEPPEGWAAAALAEGVSADGPEPLQQHDVYSLW